jgi:hypothetical protein
MQQVKMAADMVDVARRAEDRWYVTIGHAAVGPVNLDLLARGVEAGKVPLGAFVRHEQWTVWRPLYELAIIEGDGAEALRSAGDSADDITDPGHPSTPSTFASGDVSVESGDPLAPRRGSSSQRDALMLLMTAAVARGGADAAIVHEIDEEGAVAVCAHGPSRWEVLGVHTPLLDPAVVAAATGATLVVEPDPRPGSAGASVAARLCRLAGPIEGALLIPIQVHDRLVVMLEVGRRAPFRPEEVASLEALVEALSLTRPSARAG